MNEIKYLPERIINKIRVDGFTSCWLWLGALSTGGFGQSWWRGKPRPTHRITYEVLVAPIPDGYVLVHSCGTRHCLNPEHLTALSYAAARATAECPKGHPYDEDNARINKAGCAVCRTCDRARSRRTRERRRAEPSQ